MNKETWENDNKTWGDELAETNAKLVELFYAAKRRPLEDLIRGSIDISSKMDVGTAIAILVGELQRQDSRIKILEGNGLQD